MSDRFNVKFIGERRDGRDTVERVWDVIDRGLSESIGRILEITEGAKVLTYAVCRGQHLVAINDKRGHELATGHLSRMHGKPLLGII